MSNPSEFFECQWRPSRCLLALYLLAFIGALSALWLAAIPLWISLTGSLLCLVHAVWALPRQILLNTESAFVGLRYGPSGWQLRSRKGEWQAIELRRDSLALPLAVVLRFRVEGQWWTQGLCILPDALDATAHRRLRVRLKFSRNRWSAAE